MDLANMFNGTSMAAPADADPDEFLMPGLDAAAPAGGANQAPQAAAADGPSYDPYVPGVTAPMMPPGQMQMQGMNQQTTGPDDLARRNKQNWRDMQVTGGAQAQAARMAQQVSGEIMDERQARRAMMAAEKAHKAAVEARREELKQCPSTRYVGPDTKVVRVDKRYFGFMSDLIRVSVFSLAALVWEFAVRRKEFSWGELKDRVSDSFGALVIALVILYFVMDRMFVLVPDWEQPSPSDLYAEYY